MSTEFDRWAKKFESRRLPDGRVVPEKCMFAVKEGRIKLLVAVTRTGAATVIRSAVVMHCAMYGKVGAVI